MRPQLTPRQFYTFGVWAFVIIGLASLSQLIIGWNNLDFAGIVIKIFQFAFNIGIALFFNYLLNQLPEKQIEQKTFSENELEDLTKDFN